MSSKNMPKRVNKPLGAINTGSIGVSKVRKEDGIQLGEKVTKDSQGIKLLQNGYLQTFIDFFYLTTETTPCIVKPSPKLQEEYQMNKRVKNRFDLSEETLKWLSSDLEKAEDYLREGHTIECINQYSDIGDSYKQLNDFETASYFYQRILEVSKEAKYPDGEVQAYMKLGICEENVLNPFESMSYHETALEKAIDENLKEYVKEVSKQLVRVYKNIAKSYENKEEFERSLEYFEKCLDACKKADDAQMEAKCYYKIGIIHEKMNDLDRAIEYVKQFLNICKSDSGDVKMDPDKKLTGKAHKKLAELHSKLGNSSEAIKELEALLEIAMKGSNKQGQAEAALKLGLLNYKENLIPTCVNYLTKHFELVKQMGESGLVDCARVNLGIAKAQQNVQKFKNLVLTDVHDLIKFMDDAKS